MDEPKLDNLERVHLGEGIRFERWVWIIKETKIVHHPSEPAAQYKNGDWGWFWMGEFHRWDGPAVFQNGEYQYWIHYQKLSREEWLDDPRRLEWIREQAKNI